MSSEDLARRGGGGGGMTGKGPSGPNHRQRRLWLAEELGAKIKEGAEDSDCVARLWSVALSDGVLGEGSVI